MESRTHIIFASVLLSIVAWWWVTERSPGSVASAESQNVAGAEPEPVQSDAETQSQFEALERDKQSQAEELYRRAADRERRDQAGAKTEEFRKQLQFSKTVVWLQVLSTNAQLYNTLRTQAAAAPDGTVNCTICNSRGILNYCVLCDNDGRCPTCLGTGLVKFSDVDICPTCLGSKKCYLCGGSGKMTCPFCNDGIIDIKSKPPPNRLPID